MTNVMKQPLVLDVLIPMLKDVDGPTEGTDKLKATACTSGKKKLQNFKLSVKFSQRDSRVYHGTGFIDGQAIVGNPLATSWEHGDEFHKELILNCDDIEVTDKKTEVTFSMDIPGIGKASRIVQLID